jgi:transcriptional regulator with XRE-family HTH domain
MAKRIGGKRVSPEVAFGKVLAALRRARSLSQDELAHRSGYHRTYISFLERGLKSPSLRTIFDLSNTLKTRVTELMNRVEKIVGR